MKIVFIIFFAVLSMTVLAQPKERYTCIFFNQILEYIKIDHPKRLNAMDSIGGTIVGTVMDKKFIVENNSTLPDSVFYGIVNHYDLVNLRKDPMLSQDYSTIIVIDTLGFFDSSCTCFNPGSSKYSLSRNWIFDKDIVSKDTLLIKLLAVMTKDNQLKLSFTTSQSKRYFGFFYFDLGNLNHPVLSKIKFDFLHINVDDMIMKQRNKMD